MSENMSSESSMWRDAEGRSSRISHAPMIENVHTFHDFNFACTMITPKSDHEEVRVMVEGIPDALVRAVYMNLELLLHQNPIVFAELVSLARDTGHKLSDDAHEVITAYEFFDATGRLHSTCRRVILASTRGDGLNLSLLPL